MWNLYPFIPLRAISWCAGGCSIPSLHQDASGSHRLCWAGVSLKAGHRAPELQYSSNPFTLACSTQQEMWDKQGFEIISCFAKPVPFVLLERACSCTDRGLRGMLLARCCPMTTAALPGPWQGGLCCAFPNTPQNLWFVMVTEAPSC